MNALDSVEPDKTRLMQKIFETLLSTLTCTSDMEEEHSRQNSSIRTGLSEGVRRGFNSKQK